MFQGLLPEGSRVADSNVRAEPTLTRAAPPNLSAPMQSLLDGVRLRHALPRPEERKRIREEAGVSLREMAEALGVTHTAVVKWEEGAEPRKGRAEYVYLLRQLEEIVRASE